MKEALISIYHYYISYCGNSKIMLIFLVSLIYLAFRGKEKRIKIVYPSILMMVIILNPVFYKYIWNVLISSIYWRMMWMIPVIPVIAVAATDLATRFKNIGIKIAVTIAFICMIVVAGSNIYSKEDLFIKADNVYKLPEQSVSVTKELLKYDDNPVVIMPQSLFCYARQYSARVTQLYGRNVFTFISYIKPEDLKAFKTFEADNPDYDYVLNYAHFNKCEYIVQNENKPIEEELLDKYEYELLSNVDGFNIYKCNRPANEKNSWMITQNGRDDKMESYYTLQDSNGNLIIIDGGNAYNRANLEKIIECYDRHISAWILTNYGASAVGAFDALMRNNRGIKIDNIYVPDISEEDYLTKTTNEKAIEMYKKVSASLSEKEGVTVLKTNDVLEYDNLSIRVLSAGYTSDLNTSNGGTILMLETENNKMLYCSNLTQNDEMILASEKAELLKDIDFLQIPRNGKNGWDENFYGIINPSVAFLDGSKLKEDTDTKEITWMEINEHLEKQGTKIYTYSTYPNVVVME